MLRSLVRVLCSPPTGPEQLPRLWQPQAVERRFTATVRRMALSRRSSREILLDGVSYRWAVSIDSGFGVVVIQHGSGSGQRLEAQISPWNHGDDRSVTPRGIATLVSYGLSHGWDPETSGPPLQLKNVSDSVDLFI